MLVSTLKVSQALYFLNCPFGSYFYFFFYFFTRKQVTLTDLICLQSCFHWLLIYFFVFFQLYQHNILYSKTFYFHICILNLDPIKNNEITFPFQNIQRFLTHCIWAVYQSAYVYDLNNILPLSFLLLFFHIIV